MPDVFHWLGVRRIDRWVSMSNVKHEAARGQGIEVGRAGARSRRVWCRPTPRSRSRRKRRPATFAGRPTRSCRTRGGGTCAARKGRCASGMTTRSERSPYCSARPRSRALRASSLRGGRARRDPAFPPGARAARRRGRAGRRGDPPALPRPRRAVAQPVAAFLRRRHRAGIAGRAGRRPGGTARARLDLAIVSVLLDAGAGRAGSIAKPKPGSCWRAPRGWRSPACARCGPGCSRPTRGGRGGPTPLRSRALDRRALGRPFSTRPDNPITGVEGRAACCAGWAKSRARSPTLRRRRRGSATSTISGCRSRGGLPRAEMLRRRAARAWADLAGPA